MNLSRLKTGLLALLAAGLIAGCSKEDPATVSDEAVDDVTEAVTETADDVAESCPHAVDQAAEETIEVVEESAADVPSDV